MNFVSIEGNDLPGVLRSIDGIMLSDLHIRTDRDGRIKVQTFCSDQAVLDMRAIGLVVSVEVTSQQLDDHLNNLEDDIDGATVV